MDHQCKLKTAIVKSVLKGIFKDNRALPFRCLLGCFATCPCRRVLGTERQKFRMSPLGAALTEGQDPSGRSVTMLLGVCLPPHPLPALSQCPDLWGPGIRSTVSPRPPLHEVPLVYDVKIDSGQVSL